MKKTFTKSLVWIFAAVAVLSACTDDDKPFEQPGLDSTFNATYTDGTAYDLNLTYSGHPLPGKSAGFTLIDEMKGQLSLSGILMEGGRITLTDIPLKPTAAGYYFSGNGVAGDGTTFSYSGTVTQKLGTDYPVMDLAIDKITIPDNYLTRVGTFKMSNYSSRDVSTTGTRRYIRTHTSPVVLWWTYWNSQKQEEDRLLNIDVGALSALITLFGMTSDANSLVHSFLSKFIYLVLDDITFQPDGNVIANYCPLPENLDIMSIFTGSVSESDREEAIASPMNLLNYRVHDNTVYIKPDLALLLDLLGLDLDSLTRSEGEGNENPDLSDIITKLLPTIMRWTSEGIRFNFVPNDPEQIYYEHQEPYLVFLTRTYLHAYAGDFKLYLDENELEFVIANFDMLMNLLNVDLSNIELMGINIGGLITPVLDNIPYTHSLNLGLYLFGEDPLEIPEPEEPEE